VTAIGLWAIAASNPDMPAVISPDGGVVSYAELARAADRYGRGFQALGLEPGDAVATLLPNGVTALAAYFAAIETGLYIVPVNWHQVAARSPTSSPTARPVPSWPMSVSPGRPGKRPA
jgi:long-chain acyl-CoA synthetase